MILFGPRYRELLSDIYDHGVLPQDFSIYLHHPTVTDPSVAPPGKSTFYALVRLRTWASCLSTGTKSGRFWKSESSTRSGGG